MNVYNDHYQPCNQVAIEQTKRSLRNKKERRALLLWGVLLSSLLSLSYVYKPGLLDAIDYKIYDVMVGYLPLKEEKGIPVIVDVDEQSLAEFGQWPWPRYRIALLLEKLKQAGVLSVGVDILFTEPDRTSLGILQEEISRELNIQFTFNNLPQSFYDNDQILAETLLGHPFVLGYKFIFEQRPIRISHCHLHPLNAIILKDPDRAVNFIPLFNASDVACSLSKLSETVQTSGFLNYTADRDGTIRRTPLFIRYNDQLYPSLALATFMQAVQAQKVLLKMSTNGVESLKVKKYQIPLDSQGNLLIRYRGPKHMFEYLSARDLLNDQIPKEKLEGKIVFLGASALGLEDNHPTPFDILYPGVEIHATIVDNILQGNFFSKPNWVIGSEFVAILVLGILSSVLLTWTKALKSVCLLIVIIFGLCYGSQEILKMYGIFISPLFTVLTLTITFSSLTFIKFWFHENRLKEQTRELLRAQDLTIFSLLSLVETRDNETGEHIIRTQQYVQILAKKLATYPKFQHFLNETTIDYLYKSAPLHDIGKVGVPDKILRKGGTFNIEEFEEMKKHTVYGRDAIIRAELALGDEIGSSFLCCSQEITYTHHEKWDGTGYPQGLKGEEIPISGRLMALADVYDALLSKRAYKSAFGHEEAKAIILEGRGTHFDPDVVDAFLEIEAVFKKISVEFADSETHPHPLPGGNLFLEGTKEGWG